MKVIIAKRYKFVDDVLVEKQCSRCEAWKPLDEICNDNRKKYGKGSLCVSCRQEKDRRWIRNNRQKHNERNKAYYEKNKDRINRNPSGSRYVSPEYRRATKLKSQYGLSVTGYENLLQKQNGVCAICGSDNKGKRLHVDHDHKTGRVRGLLCNDCNLGIGRLKDDVGILEKAIDYLKKLFT